MNGQRHLAVITQPRSSSGLGGYLIDAFGRRGWRVDTVNALASRWHKIPSAIRSIRLNKEDWWRARWENDLFSPWAWRRNTDANGKILARIRQSGTVLLQVGKEYYPKPGFDHEPYYLFLLYNMKLSLGDGVTPWVPKQSERNEFIRMETELFRRAKHIFVGGTYVRNNLVEEYGVDGKRVSVVHGGVHPYYIEHAASVVPEQLTRRIIFVGWDFGMKGGATLLKAFARARERIPELALDVVGPDASQQIEAPGVVWHGQVPDRQKLIELYRGADLFVMPSLRDSFGFVFLEAMTQGLPCIGTAMNAMPEIIREGETGYLVPPGDDAALAGAIERYYATPGQRRRMGEAALKSVTTYFTWDRVAEDMERIMGEAD